MYKGSSGRMHLAKGRNSCLGRDHGNQFDWDAIASGAGDPRAAELLQRVCNRTKWRKSMGKQCTEFPQFTATAPVAGWLGRNRQLGGKWTARHGQHLVKKVQISLNPKPSTGFSGLGFGVLGFRV